MIRILIIDNQDSVLENLKVLLESQTEFEVVGTAKDSQNAIELVLQLQPDLAIIDPVMFGDDSIDRIYFIAQLQRVIVYTESPHQLNEAILAGAKGYLLKDSSIIDLTAAIYAVQRENVYIGRGILDRVRLASVDLASKIKNTNLWLATEVLHLLRDFTPIRDSIAEETMDKLNFSRTGLSSMKQHLCYQKDRSNTITEDAVSEIEKLFAQITNSTNPKQKLKQDKQLILDLLDENSIDNQRYISTIKDNFDFLYAVTSKNVAKTIEAIEPQVSPLPLLAFFQSTQKYLLDWQKYLEREQKDNLENRKSALVSFERVWQSRNKLLQKLDICRKAAILALQSQIEAEICGSIAQIVSEAIERFGVQIDILNQANGFLLEAIAQLQPNHQIDSVVLNLYIEQLQSKISIEELQHSLEEAVGQPLNRWSDTVERTIITDLLLKKLKPITREIYFDLRREALAISFLEYAEDNYRQKDRN